MKKIYLGLGFLALSGAFVLSSCGDDDKKRSIDYKSDETDLEIYNQLTDAQLSSKASSFETPNYDQCDLDISVYKEYDGDKDTKEGKIHYVKDSFWTYGNDAETALVVAYAGVNASSMVLDGVKNDMQLSVTLGVYSYHQWYEAKDGSGYKLVAIKNVEDDSEPQTMYMEIDFDKYGYRDYYYGYNEGYGKNKDDSKIVYAKEVYSITYDYSSKSNQNQEDKPTITPIAKVSDDTDLTKYTKTTTSNITSKVAKYSTKYSLLNATIDSSVKTGDDIESVSGSANFKKEYGQFSADASSDQEIVSKISFLTYSFDGFVYEYSHNDMAYGAFDSKSYYEANDGSGFKYVAIMNADDETQSIKLVIEWDQYGYRASYKFFSEGYFEDESNLVYQKENANISYSYSESK